jgi:hypothetical protein
MDSVISSLEKITSLITQYLQTNAQRFFCSIDLPIKNQPCHRMLFWKRDVRISISLTHCLNAMIITSLLNKDEGVIESICFDHRLSLGLLWFPIRGPEGAFRRIDLELFPAVTRMWRDITRELRRLLAEEDFTLISQSGCDAAWVRHASTVTSDRYIVPRLEGMR